MINSSKKKKQDVSARRRKMQQKGKVPWGYIVPTIIIIIVIIGLIYYETVHISPTSNITIYPPSNHDWPIPILSTEGLYLHIHPWLTISINGANVTIPSGIGIQDPVQGSIYNGQPVYGGGGQTEFEPVHTHDDTGIIHIESPTNTNYTLGQFFEIWAATYPYVNFSGSERPIVFNNTDILGFKVNSTSSLKLLVNGAPAPQGDFVGDSNSNLGNLVLNVLAYCDSSNSNAPPCSVTAGGNPIWDNGNAPYPYSTGQAIEIQFTS